PSGPASIALELNRTMRLEDFIQHVATVLHAQGAAIALFQGQTDNPLLPALPLVSLLPRSHPTLRHIMGQSHYPMPTDLFYFVPPPSSGSSSTVGYHHTAVRTSAGVPLLFSHPQSACVADLTANLLHQSPATSVLRDRCKSYPAHGLLCEIYFSKIVRYMDPQRLLSSIDARRMLYFIPSLLPVDCFPIAPARRIQFVHFEPLTSRQLASSVQAQALSLFGVPFFLDVLPDEELSSVIQRVLHYLEHYSGIPTLDYASWKWAVLSDSTDHSTIERYFSDQREGIDPTVEVIGLEHLDPSQVPTVAPAISIAP
ncbi:MAG: hypothetical protein Q8P67_13890, partial [archaeon]|nr:hypothetical protein [archaeon]